MHLSYCWPKHFCKCAVITHKSVLADLTLLVALASLSDQSKLHGGLIVLHNVPKLRFDDRTWPVFSFVVDFSTRLLFEFGKSRRDY